MFNRELSSFVPRVYENIIEMDDIINSEQTILDTTRQEMYTAFSNTFAVTANQEGVEMFEKMLEIVADPMNESLEFRRQRIINRLSMTPPFTFRFLKQKLDEIVGKDLWKAYIDFDNYTLYVESSAINQQWYSEVAFTINRIKPCNMVFTNVPYLSELIHLNEEISHQTLIWKYRLGSWLLGKDPFAEIEEKGVIKMATINSIQPELLNDTANFIVDEVSKVLINNSIEITQFTQKSSDENTVTLKYAVAPSTTELITNIKLLKEDDTVISDSNVYVPVVGTIICKHTIKVKEGV